MAVYIRVASSLFDKFKFYEFYNNNHQVGDNHNHVRLLYLYIVSKVVVVVCIPC